MNRTGFLALGAAVLALVAGAAWWRLSPPSIPNLPGLTDAQMSALYANPLPAPDGPLRVFHIGHSLVNHDIPAMLAQLAGNGHQYESQLGSFATLKAHWGDAALMDAEIWNASPHFREASEAVSSGDYDAVVLTEMLDIRDSLRFHDSPGYLAKFAAATLQAAPDTRIYLYETWHWLDDPEGWLDRLDADLARYWDAALLRPALYNLPEGTRIHLIPVGQAMATLVREIESRGGVGNLRDRSDLFSDQIHLNDMGNYFAALVHYSVLYGSSPEGLPHNLLRADGTPAVAPTPEAARLLQDVAWRVAKKFPATGLSQDSQS